MDLAKVGERDLCQPQLAMIFRESGSECRSEGHADSEGVPRTARSWSARVWGLGARKTYREVHSSSLCVISTAS